jgi:hypothetical protein
MTVSMIPPETIKAYTRAVYCVLSPEPFDLKIGEVSQPLLNLYGSCNCVTSAFLTAFNPLGILASDDENVEAQCKLEACLVEKSIVFTNGIGKDKKGLWPGEKSVLALGMQIEEAKIIGVSFRQNAIVWIGEDAKPELILLG